MGKRKTLALGVYPDLSLTDARTAHQKARTLLANGQDPMEVRNTAKSKEKAEAQEKVTTFEVVAREWFETKIVNRTEKYRKEMWQRIVKHFLSYIGTPLW